MIFPAPLEIDALTDLRLSRLDYRQQQLASRWV
jgi:hypothetical protein